MAAVDETGKIVFDNRIPLVVPEGKKGLRQSDMVFAHIKNISGVSQYAENLTAVAASTRPRPVDGSYMPVFVVAENVGRVVADTCGAKFYALTHQHGHIGAALIDMDISDGEYLAMHVSGGTTEILRFSLERGIANDISVIGGTLDISAGQLIDRVAQKLGLPFPGGAHIEQLAKKGKPFLVKTSVSGMNANFSGAEAILFRSMEIEAKEDIASSTLDAAAKTLRKMAENAVNETGIKTVVFMGGVMRNLYIRSYIADSKIINAKFAHVELSSDNACGLAYQARNIFLNNMED